VPDREWWQEEWDRTQYDVDRYNARIKELLTILGGKCRQCESVDDLQFDHLDPTTKKFSITSRWNARLNVLLPELEKCQLLCRACHLDKTNRHRTVPHGGGKSGKHNCRCEPCRLRRRERARELRRLK
jgi:5-methylcytosine-specific restriction endonuclease McrA